MDLVVVAVAKRNPVSSIFQLQPPIPQQENSPSSVIARIVLTTTQPKCLVDKRIAVNIADSPVQDAYIRARSQNQFGCFGRPEPVVFGNTQAVADADDVGGPIAAGPFDFERACGGLSAVDVGEEDGFGAVVEDQLRGDGVGGGGEGDDGGGGEGDGLHGCYLLGCYVA